MKNVNVKNVVFAMVGAIVASLGFLIKKNWEVIKDKFKHSLKK